MPRILPLWRCTACDAEVRSDPLASDDWEDGEPVAIGPDCPECGDEMAAVDEEQPLDLTQEELDALGESGPPPGLFGKP